MNKEDLTCLIGKYLNGYKIVKIENDTFIKGQINLYTDEWEYGAFNDRGLVKFFIRDEGNSSKIYKELVDKENYEYKEPKRIEEFKLFTPYPECTDDRFEQVEDKINELIKSFNRYESLIEKSENDD